MRFYKRNYSFVAMSQFRCSVELFETVDLQGTCLTPVCFLSDEQQIGFKTSDSCSCESQNLIQFKEIVIFLNTS